MIGPLRHYYELILRFRTALQGRGGGMICFYYHKSSSLSHTTLRCVAESSICTMTQRAPARTSSPTWMSIVRVRPSPMTLDVESSCSSTFVNAWTRRNELPSCAIDMCAPATYTYGAECSGLCSAPVTPVGYLSGLLAADLILAVQIFAGPRPGRSSLHRCECRKHKRRRRVLGLHPNVESSDSYTRAVQGFETHRKIYEQSTQNEFARREVSGSYAGRGSVAEERT
ncbi:hypothetical protein VTO73DRAFT_13895 [Trametes versicolor]